MTGSSTQGIRTVLHPVSDLEKAKAVFGALLGVAPEPDEPYYVGYEVGDVPRIHLAGAEVGAHRS